MLWLYKRIILILVWLFFSAYWNVQNRRSWLWYEFQNWILCLRIIIQIFTFELPLDLLKFKYSCFIQLTIDKFISTKKKHFNTNRCFRINIYFINWLNISLFKRMYVRITFYFPFILICSIENLHFLLNI